MILELENILSPETLSIIDQKLNQAQFVDGKNTAGWHAKTVKDNLQMSINYPEAETLNQIIYDALKDNLIFQMATLPKTIHSLRFSRYEEGMSYGSHVDNALMGISTLWRSDISFTLFLNSPSEYQGGELVLEEINGEKFFKLNAGSLILYPSTTLHRVEKVTFGVRKVVVGWIQSLIRDELKREILFDLDTVRRALFHREGKTTEFDLLCKSHSNLLRSFAEN
ncbi:iron-uptake factor PiuC [Geminocystis sp. NIES-3708]|uniref:Fe2+-dependent dioxygenase n=1 Tax=Geminocystis sp. NIES-3708 TaxID=1615909 RepID=UPI0005FC8BDD|nr:Fe2+-dependent dioxygenase [Geminocystis sp. NIES-3708]BAQ62149.1 iron-uptake factor PiuC [Geminocystis sp. NIES-3708]